MDEIMYGSEQFKKKNGYSKKKPLTQAEKKEKNIKKQEKLFSKLERLQQKELQSRNTIENEPSNNNNNCKEYSITDLKSLVSNIENR